MLQSSNNPEFRRVHVIIIVSRGLDTTVYEQPSEDEAKPMEHVQKGGERNEEHHAEDDGAEDTQEECLVQKLFGCCVDTEDQDEDE
mmetsp:Transcript_116795/g.225237  ORF Transcript_116795/g.225237 Transcript_116795/m.225237 type:complete len:86 (-) Transcript_116795:680-937(-)